MSAASSAPSVGQPLPRADDAYAASEKLEWILAEHGHGPEWARVLCVAGDDSERLWSAIAQAVLDAPVSSIRDLSPFGVGCEVRVVLTLNARTAPVLTAWHYRRAGDAPRLITAYPIP
jgi:hypothetical protein